MYRKVCMYVFDDDRDDNDDDDRDDNDYDDK
jgi:hypothetical protein